MGSPFLKEYHVTTTSRMPDTALSRMRAGMDIRIRGHPVTTLPCEVERLSPRRVLESVTSTRTREEENNEEEDEEDASSRHLQFILKVSGFKLIV